MKKKKGTFSQSLQLVRRPDIAPLCFVGRLRKAEKWYFYPTEEYSNLYCVRTRINLSIGALSRLSGNQVSFDFRGP